jgi:hypothetical protein
LIVPQNPLTRSDFKSLRRKLFTVGIWSPKLRDRPIASF